MSYHIETFPSGKDWQMTEVLPMVRLTTTVTEGGGQLCGSRHSHLPCDDRAPAVYSEQLRHCSLGSFLLGVLQSSSARDINNTHQDFILDTLHRLLQ